MQTEEKYTKFFVSEGKEIYIDNDTLKLYQYSALDAEWHKRAEITLADALALPNKQFNDKGVSLIVEQLLRDVEKTTININDIQRELRVAKFSFDEYNFQHSPIDKMIDSLLMGFANFRDDLVGIDNMGRSGKSKSLYIKIRKVLGYLY